MTKNHRDGIFYSNPNICTYISCNIIFLYRNNNMFVCIEGYFVTYETHKYEENKYPYN